MLLSAPPRRSMPMHDRAAHPEAHTSQGGAVSCEHALPDDLTANMHSLGISQRSPYRQQKGSGDACAYTSDGGIRIKGSVSGVASLAGQTTVAIIVVCVALLNYILVALISLTATFSKSQERRDAALQVLRILTKHALQAEKVISRASEEGDSSK